MFKANPRKLLDGSQRSVFAFSEIYDGNLGTVQSWCDLAAWVDGGRIRLVGEPKYVVEKYREAVMAAEAEQATTGHSALQAPGGALPKTPGQN